jgi:outer membrane scaffolding protein for murein synthesis (MipA/OmpV family)
LLAAWAQGAQAELKPLWELGAGLAAVDFPLYRGAPERRSYLLPAPYVQYRGKFLQVERERVRGLLWRAGPWELDLDVNGTVPVSSRDSALRRGMPDLDPTLELGPSLNLHLHDDARSRTHLDLRLPLRAAHAVNFGRFERVGWLAQPQFNLDLRGLLPGWSLSLQGSLLYGDRGYHAYFYDVAPEYATPTRPAYSAPGGFAGRQLLLALSRRQGPWWLGAFLKWDDLSAAVFADSPLVQRSYSFAGGLMLARVLAQSSRLVDAGPD